MITKTSGTRTYTPIHSTKEFPPNTLYVAGASGCIGKDLIDIADLNGIEVLETPEHAEFVALCTPSYIAQTLLDNKSYDGKVIIDMSGAVKQSDHGQYGLMAASGFSEDGVPIPLSRPEDPRLDPSGNIYGNPGCIASAVIRGLGAAGLTGDSLPHELSIFSVGGQSHAHEIGSGAIKLARRLNAHPHVTEIERHFDQGLTVSSFIPTVCDIPHGLLVAIHGKTRYSPHFDPGQPELQIDEVLSTDSIRHRLELPDSHKVDGQEVNFSLAVIIDNLRFVTSNAVKLIQYISQSR